MLWIVPLLALVTLALTVLNLFLWPRGPRGALTGRVSVLIPARNEANRIEKTIRHVLACGHQIHEVLVYNDQSADATEEIVRAIAAQHASVRLLRGGSLPNGWVGKPHACHRLALEATGEWLIFLDADTLLKPNGLAYLAGTASKTDADVLSAVPQQVTGSWFEHLILPLLHLSYTSWFLLPLVWWSRDPRFMAANGQLLAVRASTYFSTGGFDAIRSQIVDDMAFCKSLKAAGHRVVFADGFLMAQCRMYSSAHEVWNGFSKNIYDGLGARTAGLATAVAIYTWAYLLPWFTIILSTAAPSLLGPSAVGILANISTRVLLAVRFRQSWMSVGLHPVAIISLIAIAINSWRWHSQGGIRWRGRTYDTRNHQGLNHE